MPPMGKLATAREQRNPEGRSRPAVALLRRGVGRGVVKVSKSVFKWMRVFVESVSEARESALSGLVVGVERRREMLGRADNLDGYELSPKYLANRPRRANAG